MTFCQFSMFHDFSMTISIFQVFQVFQSLWKPWPLFPLFFLYYYLYFPYFSAFFLEFCYLYLNQWQSRNEYLSHLRGNNRRPIKCHWIFSAVRACFPMVIMPGVLCLSVPPCLAAMFGGHVGLRPALFVYPSKPAISGRKSHDSIVTGRTRLLEATPDIFWGAGAK